MSVFVIVGFFMLVLVRILIMLMLESVIHLWLVIASQAGLAQS